MTRLSKNDITSIMVSGNYGVCYEPIVKIEDMEIIGYEALSRFKYKNELVSPNSFFKVAHEDIDFFFYIESVLKQFQLKHRIRDKKLFLNLDPDICIQENQIEFWVEQFQSYEDIVVEIIENSDEESMEDVMHFMEWMDMYKLPYAYDDFGKPNSIFFTSLLDKSNYLKLDIYFLQTIKVQPSYMEILKGMVRFARLNNKYTILEGVETEDDLKIAKEAGVDYIQGYLFKPEFISIWNVS